MHAFQKIRDSLIIYLFIGTEVSESVQQQANVRSAIHIFFAARHLITVFLSIFHIRSPSARNNFPLLNASQQIQFFFFNNHSTMLAENVSFRRRFLQCGSAVFWCLLSGGPIFGFAALKPVLIKEHVYEYACDVSINATTATSNYWAENFVMDPEKFSSLSLMLAKTTSSDQDIVAKCTNQDLKLNMMFTVGAMVTNVSAFVIGRCLDIYGPKVCGLIGAVFLYIACFIFIFGKDIENSALSFLDPYLIGYASMALGGPFAYISSFQLSNSFPQKSGTILAILTGAFDASSAVFLIFRLIYNATNQSFGLVSFFQLYLVVPIFITLAQIFIMPWDSYKTGPDTDLCANDSQEVAVAVALASETDPLLSSQMSPSAHSGRRDSIGDALKQPYAEEGEEFLIEHSGGIFGILHGFSAEYQMKTPWFYLMCCFATIMMLRLNYFVATIGTQYIYLLGSATKGTLLNRFFDIALPLGGIISIPFVGLFLDYCTTVVVLTALLGVSLTIGVLGLIPNIYAGFLNVILFVAYRPFFYTAVSDFCAKVFGFDTFGTVYGAMICVSGAFNFFQSTLDKITHTTFHMNPTPINAILVTITLVVGVAMIAYTRHQAVLFQQKKTRLHAHA